MFDLSVFFLTMQKVAFLLIFIFAGYLLRRSGKLGKSSTGTVSVLTTFLFAPAYSIVNLSQTFTVENLGSNLAIAGLSLLLLPFIIIFARFLAGRFAKDDFEKRTFSYMFAFANTGYFGYPVIQGVFGEEMLSRFMVFCLPLNLAINSYGYSLFLSAKGGFSLKKTLLSPLMIGCYAGCFLGLTGLEIPPLLGDTLSGAASCMSPASMILAGLVMGAFPLKKLLSGLRPYLLGAVRLLLIPAVFALPLYFCGVRGIYLFLSLVTMAMPTGMNIVIYPESLGLDASDNAKFCFVSTLTSILTLPVVFALAKAVSGL